MLTDDRRVRCGTRTVWENLDTALEGLAHEGIAIDSVVHRDEVVFIHRVDGVAVRFSAETRAEEARRMPDGRELEQAPPSRVQ